VAELQLTYGARRKLAELRALEEGLSRYATPATNAAPEGQRAICVILEDLSDGNNCCR